MATNDPYNVDPIRAPRLRILCDGKEIAGAISASISNNSYYQADTFRAQFSLNADPDFGIAFWGDANRKQFLLDIQFSIDAGQTWKSFITGQVDHLSIKLEHGVCDVDGRDLTAYFIDTKTQTTYMNKTSSQIVEMLAESHGMKADTTETGTPVGRFYSDDRDRITAGQFQRSTTEWNLLCGLAQHEQFDVWVTGTTVHFHPSVDPSNADPFVVRWEPDGPWSNAVTLDLDRSMFMAKDVVVQVRSWNSRQGRGFTKFAPSGSRIAAVQSGKQQLFSFVVPNLTEAEAQSYSEKLRAEITQHERLFEFSAPADLTLDARSMVQFSGTGTSFDDKYFVTAVTRSIGFDSGFTMNVKCKNHSPVSTVLAS
jgi:hypothetical protein